MMHSEKPQPFVGICGIQTSDELYRLEKCAPTVLIGTGRFLMAGIKSTRDIGDLGPLVHVRPFVHCDFQEGVPFEDIVYRNLEAASPYVRGLQLNALPWPEVDFGPMLSRVKQRFPHILLMLQVHYRTMADYSPHRTAESSRELPIDYLFFDPSQSRGLPYNLAQMAEFVDVGRKVCPSPGIVVAGGLGPQTMEPLFWPLMKAYPDLSCDAFGQLNDRSSGRLSWPKVDSYLSIWKEGVISSRLAC